MIPLRISAEAPDAVLPFVARVGLEPISQKTPELPAAPVIASGPWGLELATPAGRLVLKNILHADCAGDILLVVPERQIAHRLIRRGSAHNTFLVTEQCDQYCVMCSQPPKKHHVDLYPYFEAAALLAPHGITIGVSGGEPTLHKAALFSFLASTLSKRPDLSFHVLTNAQHFTEEDIGTLSAPALRRSVTWGIPLYADTASHHDEIVGKVGAFARLSRSFAALARAGAQIELRTVLLRQNVDGLAELASHVARRLPFVARWAIMQLENIGFARKNWHGIFCDHSSDFGPVARALDIARARGIDVRLYNFPLCTVPVPYRPFADCSISDWKRRYLNICQGCTVRAHCAGFFEWYPERHGFRTIAPQ